MQDKDWLLRTGMSAIAAAILLSACGDAKKDDASAYSACVQHAKGKLPKAEFSPLERAKLNSLQDGTVAVIVSYKNEGKDGSADCNVQKQQDQSFKVNYSNLP